MLLAMIAGVALGTMPVPQFEARKLDVSQASLLASTTAELLVWTDLTVDTSGRVAACAIAVSSGSSLVDRVACERAERVARFTPGRDEAGQPIVAIVRQGFGVNRALPLANVDFALVVDRARPGAVADLRVVADAGGKVETCTVDVSSGSGPLDRAACGAVMSLVRPAARDAAGTPVRALSRLSVGFSTSAVSPK